MPLVKDESNMDKSILNQKLNISLNALRVGKEILGYRVEFERKNSKGKCSRYESLKGWRDIDGSYPETDKWYAIDVSASLKGEIKGAIEKVFSGITVLKGEVINGSSRDGLCVFKEDDYIIPPNEATSREDLILKLENFNRHVLTEFCTITKKAAEGIISELEVCSEVGDIDIADLSEGSYTLDFQSSALYDLEEVAWNSENNNLFTRLLISKKAHQVLDTIKKVIGSFLKKQKVYSNLYYKVKCSEKGWVTVKFG